MKKIISVLLVFTVAVMSVFGLTACGDSENIDIDTFGISLSDLSDLMDEMDLPVFNFNDWDKANDEVDSVMDYVSGEVFTNPDDYIMYLASAYESFAFVAWCDVNHDYAQLAVNSVNKDKNSVETWDLCREANSSLGECIDLWLEEDLSTDGYCTLCVLINPNTFLVLLASYAGEVIYDVTEHY